jgi:hypothetical protein
MMGPEKIARINNVFELSTCTPLFLSLSLSSDENQKAYLKILTVNTLPILEEKKKKEEK